MSDVQQVDWASFRVADDGAYGGGSELEHHRGRCNWSAGIDDLNPLEISELAAAHAAMCTGLPIPPKVTEPQTPMGKLAVDIWGDLIGVHLRRGQLLMDRVSEPRTGADGA